MLHRVVTTVQLAAAFLTANFVVLLFVEEAPATRPAPSAVADGGAIYRARCAGCHGPSGEGVVGPRLAGRVQSRFPEVGDQRALVANGIAGMPAWGKILTEVEIRAVVDYTRQLEA